MYYPGDYDVISCHKCRACTGAAFQASPILAIGELDAPILIVAQNPGVFDTDTHAEFQQRWEEAETADEHLVLGYLDFAGTKADSTFAKVFGRGWLESGKFCYTNAIRCRTPNNEAPSNQMRYNCNDWTQLLLPKRKIVVVVGAVAREQVTRNNMPNGSFRRLSGTGTYVITMTHYSAWRGSEHDRYRDMFNQVLNYVETDYRPQY